jgi:photosystem II stability/assembly factor-like uncharacterized protein
MKTSESSRGPSRPARGTSGPGAAGRVRRASIMLVLLSTLLLAWVTATAAATPPALDASSAWPPAGLSSACFVTRDVGWLTAWQVSSDGSYANHVYATTDGGATWTRQFASPNQYTTVDRTLFVSQTTGWAWGRGLLRTRDGGAHWRRSPIAPLGYWIQDLQAPGGSVLWAERYYDPESQTTEVMRSTDLGASWRSVLRRSQGGAGLAAFSSRRAFLAGFARHIVSLTKDAGRTWKTVWRCPGPVYGVGSRGPSSGWVWGDWGIAHTADGGRSWRRVSDETRVHSYFTGGLAFFGDSSCWTFGPDTVWRTVDGGASWSRFPAPWSGLSDSTIIDSSQFIDDSTGWVVESGERMWRTLDGGATWTLVLSL